jgi:hypothetical protein
VSVTYPFPVAWRVEINSLTCIVFTTSKPKAQWIATKSYWYAYGRRKGVWPRASAARAMEYDSCRLRDDPPKAFSEDYLRGW